MYNSGKMDGHFLFLYPPFSNPDSGFIEFAKELNDLTQKHN